MNSWGVDVQVKATEKYVLAVSFALYDGFHVLICKWVRKFYVTVQMKAVRQYLVVLVLSIKLYKRKVVLTESAVCILRYDHYTRKAKRSVFLWYCTYGAYIEVLPFESVDEILSRHINKESYLKQLITVIVKLCCVVFGAPGHILQCPNYFFTERVTPNIKLFLSE